MHRVCWVCERLSMFAGRKVLAHHFRLFAVLIESTNHLCLLICDCWTAGLKDGANNLEVFTAVRKHKDSF